MRRKERHIAARDVTPFDVVGKESQVKGYRIDSVHTWAAVINEFVHNEVKNL